MNWHASEELLTRYATAPESLSPATADSLEQHLVTCSGCQRGVASAARDDDWLTESWAGVVDVLDRPRASIPERLLTAVGVPAESVRLAAATSTMRLVGATATLAMLGLAIATARHEGSAGPFLAVAPFVPLLAVAVAFSPIADPGGEAGRAAPIAGLGTVLRRALVILIPAVVAAGAAALTVPGSGRAALWLLPGLALAVTSAALSTWLRPHVAVGAMAVAWPVLLVVAVRMDRGAALIDTAPFRPAGQLVAATLLAVASAVVVVRRDRFSTLEVMWS